MRKISLKLDTLSVDSFQTGPAPVGAGTVDGHQLSNRLPCQPSTTCFTEYYSCAVQNSYYESCQINCDCTRVGMAC